MTAMHRPNFVSINIIYFQQTPGPHHKHNRITQQPKMVSHSAL